MNYQLYAFYNSVNILEDCSIKSIEKNSFNWYSIKSLTISKNIENIEEGFCDHAVSLIEIKISKKNKNFIYLNNSLLLGKSDPKSQVFDVLLFARSNIEKVKIPIYIKRIADSAFKNCKKLNELEIPNKSQLLSIGKDAFKYAKINKLIIPPNLSRIKLYFTFFKNSNLPFDNDNILINEGAFIIKSNPTIPIYDNLVLSYHLNMIIVPDSVKKISHSAFKNNKMLQKIIFSKTSKLEIIEDFAFYKSSIEYINFPLSLMKIGNEAFQYCNKLKNIEIPVNSKLHSIGIHSFSHTSIEEFYIPTGITVINYETFGNCQNLKKITFANKTKLEEIRYFAFEKTSIENIKIPQSVKQIESGFAFSNIKNIEFENDNFINYNNKFILGKTDPTSNNYDIIIHAYNSIKGIVIIPSFIRKISQHSFAGCKKIHSIHFNEDSKLNEFGEGAFCESSLRKICIPKLVNKIIIDLFFCCKNFEVIEFAKDSQLRIIEAGSFYSKNIKSLSIPPNVTKISSGTFQYCQLKIIEINEESKLKSLNWIDFKLTDTIVMIPVQLSHLVEK